MALTFAFYAAPSFSRPLAIGAVVVLTAVNYFGVTTTALLTRVIVTVVLASLGVVVAAVVFGGEADVHRLQPLTTGSAGCGPSVLCIRGLRRIATLGEEVVDPARTIPRAIPLALVITLIVYAAVAVTALLAIDAATLAQSPAPLRTVVEAGRWATLSPVVRFGATVASLGVLLSLLAGVSRTAFAMAFNHDLPHFLAAVHPRHRIPHHAELAVGAIVATIAAVADIRDAIGFSSFAVLTYYAVANASAFTLSQAERRWPRWLAVCGVAGCAILAVSLPVSAVIGGSGLLITGAVVFIFRAKRGHGTRPAAED